MIKHWGYRIVKRLLAGAAALATAFVLAACSGGGAAPSGPNSGGGAVAAAGTGGGTPTTSSTTSAPTSTSATPTPTETPTSTTSKAKPTPTSTTPKPKPKPKPQPPASDPAVPCAAAAAAAGTAACVDISAHQAWILQGGKVVYGPVKMLPGRPSNPTPTGTFHVLSKEFDNAEMPNSVFFYPGDAFHTGSLSVYSHGCIHLSPGASQKFFDTLHIGDIVQVVP